METAIRAAGALNPSSGAAGSAAPGQLEMHLAASAQDWDAVGDLRYRAYRQRDAILPNAEERLREPDDTAMNAMTFLLTRGGRPMGTTRTTVRTASRQWPLPGLATYRKAIESSIVAEATLVEASRTVVEPALAADSRAILFHLMKAHVLHCALEDADWLLCAVRQPDISFYRRMLNMKTLSGFERYPGLTVQMVLMGLDVRTHMDLVAKRIPQMGVSREDQETFVATGCVRVARPPAARPAKP
jgi:N-acyl amino acid synthase FeeM